MVIGSLYVELRIEAAGSLKDKRHVVKGMVESARNRFNLAAAEVDHLNEWTRAGLAFVTVANDRDFVNQVLSKALDHVESDPRVMVAHVEMELL
jgi:uncharacterized protein YlxP (DUF503 family)